MNNNEVETENTSVTDYVGWVAKLGSKSAFDIAVSCPLFPDYIAMSRNTDVKDQNYVIFGSLIDNQILKVDLVEPETAITMAINSVYIVKPKLSVWAFTPSDDGISVRWERPIKEDFNNKFSNALACLKSIQKLEPNWDFDNGIKPTTTVIARGYNLLSYLNEYLNNCDQSLSEPFIAPLSDGRIQFEWEFENNEFEVVIDDNGDMEYLLSKADNDEYFIDGKIRSIIELGDILLAEVLRKV